MGQAPEVEIEVEGGGKTGYINMMIEFSKQYPGWEIVSWGLKSDILKMKARNNSLDLSTLKKGDWITDGEEHYSVYKDGEEVDGICQVETTCMGDCAKLFKQGSVVWKEEPQWIINARARSKHLKAQE